MKYCEDCGNLLEEQVQGRVWQCENCEHHIYTNPIPAIDAMLFDEQGRFLLGRRNREPAKGKLNLPGGFIDPDESLEHGIARELKEELGLNQSDYSDLIYANSRVEYHTQQGKPRQLICIIMVGKIPHREFAANDEADKYYWLLPSELKLEDTSSPGEYEAIMQVAKLYE